MRSSSLSCPTMVFLTWYRACSSGRDGSPGSRRCGVASMGCSVLRSLQGCAGGTTGRGDGDGEPDADEVGLPRGVGEGGDDPDNGAVPVEQGAAAVAGVHGGVELDEPREGSAAGV